MGKISEDMISICEARVLDLELSKFRPQLCYLRLRLFCFIASRLRRIPQGSTAGLAYAFGKICVDFHRLLTRRFHLR